MICMGRVCGPAVCRVEKLCCVLTLRDEKDETKLNEMVSVPCHT